MTNEVLCEGHQELRDIVIETRTDVKYIREAIEALQGDGRKRESRISALEAREQLREGETRAATRHAAIIAGIISIFGTVTAITYTIWRGTG